MSVAPQRTRTSPISCGITENMPVGPAVPPRSFGGTPEATGGQSAGKVSKASPPACKGRLDLEWVPDREADTVPAQLRELCLSCPLREACLAVAIATDSEGYWAGTTTNDRRQASRPGRAVLVQVDRTVEAQLAADAAVALHGPGSGSLQWYRRGGCRCSECRRANAQNRAAQRARARAAGDVRLRRRSAA